MAFQTVGIVGVGLIGGSFGLAMRKAGFAGRIVGVSSQRSIAEALTAGAIDAGVSLEEAAKTADLLYLSQPIRGILLTIDRLSTLAHPGLLITDAGSTKAEIVGRARAANLPCQFLGGHPMAGSEARGAASGQADLFRNRPYILTPSNPVELETPEVCVFYNWIKKMGADILVLSSEEHDRLVAFTSHLPQLASTALASAVARESGVPAGRLPYGPGLLDMTRLAQSPFEIWHDILQSNSKEIRHALDVYIDRLTEFRQNLTTLELQEHFMCAADFAAHVRNKR